MIVYVIAVWFLLVNQPLLASLAVLSSSLSLWVGTQSISWTPVFNTHMRTQKNRSSHPRKLVNTRLLRAASSTTPPFFAPSVGQVWCHFWKKIKYKVVRCQQHNYIQVLFVGPATPLHSSVDTGHTGKIRDRPGTVYSSVSDIRSSSALQLVKPEERTTPSKHSQLNLEHCH